MSDLDPNRPNTTNIHNTTPVVEKSSSGTAVILGIVVIVLAVLAFMFFGGNGGRAVRFPLGPVGILLFCTTDSKVCPC